MKRRKMMSKLKRYRVEISTTTQETYFVDAEYEELATRKVLEEDKDVYFRGTDVIGSELYVEEEIQ